VPEYYGNGQKPGETADLVGRPSPLLPTWFVLNLKPDGGLNNVDSWVRSIQVFPAFQPILILFETTWNGPTS
jgi:hypothetical protein